MNWLYLSPAPALREVPTVSSDPAALRVPDIVNDEIALKAACAHLLPLLATEL